jgi:hypothetical protein
MEFFTEYSEMMKKTAGQYAQLAKKMQETTTTILEHQVSATKEYIEWSMKTNAKLVDDFTNYSVAARETMNENVEIAKKSFEDVVASTRKTA